MCTKVTAATRVFCWFDFAPGSLSYTRHLASICSSVWVPSPFDPFLPSFLLAGVASPIGMVLSFHISRANLWILAAVDMTPGMTPLQGGLAGSASTEQPEYVNSGTEAVL